MPLGPQQTVSPVSYHRGLLTSVEPYMEIWNYGQSLVSRNHEDFKRPINFKSLPYFRHDCTWFVPEDATPKGQIILRWTLHPRGGSTIDIVTQDKSKFRLCLGSPTFGIILARASLTIVTFAHTSSELVLTLSLSSIITPRYFIVPTDSFFGFLHFHADSLFFLRLPFRSASILWSASSNNVVWSHVLTIGIVSFENISTSYKNLSRTTIALSSAIPIMLASLGIGPSTGPRGTPTDVG